MLCHEAYLGKFIYADSDSVNTTVLKLIKVSRWNCVLTMCWKWAFFRRIEKELSSFFASPLSWLSFLLCFKLSNFKAKACNSFLLTFFLREAHLALHMSSEFNQFLFRTTTHAGGSLQIHEKFFLYLFIITRYVICKAHGFFCDTNENLLMWFSDKAKTKMQMRRVLRVAKFLIKEVLWWMY